MNHADMFALHVPWTASCTEIDTSALWSICRMRLYHRCRGSSAHGNSSNKPRLCKCLCRISLVLTQTKTASYSEYIQSPFATSDQPMSLATEYPEVQWNTFKEVKSLKKATVQLKLIELAVCFLVKKLSRLK